MSKPYTVQHARAISLAILGAGAVLMIVGLLDLLGDYFRDIGAWGYWLIGIGAVMTLVGVIWFVTYRLNVRKFNKLIDEKSKAVFVKQLDDVEYLAWKLPVNYEERLAVKKKNFGVK
ncbi:MAG: DUF3198 domain-containing protein [Methanomassiliicoccus sp.]|nr:DUF3198 domain-containing protein [Methanomassiliicoccus sp.]